MKFRMKNGYKQYNIGSGWRYTHRRVAEKKLGNNIFNDFEVHHQNGIKTDNRPSNLTVLSKEEHRAVHSD